LFNENENYTKYIKKLKRFGEEFQEEL